MLFHPWVHLLSNDAVEQILEAFLLVIIEDMRGGKQVYHNGFLFVNATKHVLLFEKHSLIAFWQIFVKHDCLLTISNHCIHMPIRLGHLKLWASPFRP